MRKLLLFILIPFFIYAQSAPSDSTGHIKLYQWSQGANPGATGLNNNWKKIDTAVSRGVWYPEWSGAVGNGTTDDAAAFGRAIDSARGKTLILTKPVYKIASKIEKDLADSSLTIISYSNSILYLTNTTSTASYQVPEGNIKIINGGDVTLIGVRIIGVRKSGSTYFLPLLAQGDGNSSLSNIVVENCRNVTVERCDIREAVYAGFRAVECERVYITNSTIDSNTYAGAHIVRTNQIYASGNSFSYNGSGKNTSYYGYGITASHRYGKNIDNQAYYVSGNKCWYNTRKAIDAHDAVGVFITNNHIKGSPIGVTTESGSDPDAPALYDSLWAKRVAEVFITGNLMEIDDTTWFNSIVQTAPFQWITTGAFGDSLDYSGGTINISYNIIKNCDVPDTSRAVIWCPVALNSPRLDAIIISYNTILDVNTINIKYGFPAEYDGVIYVLKNTAIPKFIDISHNNISGTSINGIKIDCENSNEALGIQVNVGHNKFIGTFTYPIYIERDLKHTTPGNTLNGELLPEMIDQFSGQIRKTVITSDASVTKDIVSINANGFTGGGIIFDIKITVASANNAFQAIYYFNAYAGNNEGTVAFRTAFIEESGQTSEPSAFRPTVQWSGSGDTRTLQVVCPTTYCGYQIIMNTSSWRLALWQTE
jgi:hypothetical protein